MKRFQSLLLVGLVLLLVVDVQARAAFKDKARMIAAADVIAVVTITQVEKASVKGRHWTYQQKATATVERALKGTVPTHVSLYGDENFICARCHFERGRYLVFLDRDGELLTGNNWHLSTWKITEDKVECFADENIFEKKTEPLIAVLKDVESFIAKSKAQDAK